MTKINSCNSCLEKQREIDKLKEEIVQLKSKLRYQENKEKEGYFGSSTPSSKIPVKANSDEENKNKKGGAEVGHIGHGRKKIKEAEADRIEEVKGEEFCSYCGVELKEVKVKRRSVQEAMVTKVEKIIYVLRDKRCPRCNRVYRVRAPEVLPRNLYGNRLISRIAIMHYVYGIPLGRITEQFGLNRGSVIQGLHRLGKIFEGVVGKLKEEYRVEGVKHADETGWRNDGSNGYAWLFTSENTSIYEFQKTRSSRVPKEVFGDGEVKGVLVVDRYNGYNKLRCDIQYCYVHLLREVKGLEKEFSDNEEVKRFVEVFSSLLSAAIHLRNLPITDEEYYKRAKELKRQILDVVRREARHSGIRYIQNIFRENEKRLYHWVENREVPADNNYAERELRPTVIARKVSFGSQSELGAKTRSTMMTILHTLKKRTKLELEDALVEGLNKIALDYPNCEPYSALFNKGSPP